MATFEEHCKETTEKLGRPFEQVHKWLDEFQDKMGPGHRAMRHNALGILDCIDQWGYEAAAAACIHIHRDEHSHEKKGALWISKPKQPSITCPRCGMTSHNPNDIEQQYCGNCHEYIKL
jgi:ribosomal protein S27AE